MNMMATYCSMFADKPISRAMAMVVDSPGMAPQSMPRVTPTRATISMVGVRARRIWSMGFKDS